MRLISKLRLSIRSRKILYSSVIFSLALYVFSVPSFGEKTGLSHYFIYIAMALAAVTSVIYLFLYEKIKIPKFSFFIPIFTIFGILGTILFSHNYRIWLTLFLLCLSFYVFLFSFEVIGDIKKILVTICIGLFLFSVYFISVYFKEIINFRNFTKSTFRLGNYFDNPNGVASYAIVFFGLSTYCLLFFKTKKRFIFGIFSFLSLIIGLSTGSRTFYFSAALFVVVYLYFLFRNHKLIFIASLISFIIIIIILLNLPFLSTLKDRLSRGFSTIFGGEEKVDSSVLSRSVYIDYGFWLGAKNLLFGYGANGFNKYSGIGTYAHSTYAELICDFGLIGLVLFYLPMIILVFNCITCKEIDKKLIIPFVVYFIFSSISNILFTKKIYYLVLSFLFYIALCGENKKSFKKLTSVVFTVDSMDAGGAEKVVSTLANSFVAKNIKVSIVIVSSLKNESFYKLDKNVSLINVQTNKRIGFLRRSIKLRKIIFEINPDIVIAFLPHVCFYSKISLIGSKYPLICSERNDPNQYSKIKQLRNFLVYKGSTSIVFQTSDARNFYGFNETNSKIIFNPISVLTNGEKRRVKKDNTFIYVGRLEKQKNPLLLIDSFAKFNLTNQNYTLHIYGDGVLKTDMQKRVKELNLDKNVIFKGKSTSWHIDEMNAAGFVLCSNYEGIPNALCEALAIGIPCISTDCPIGGPRELSKYFPLKLVSCNNKDELASAMSELVKKTYKNNNKNNEKNIFSENYISEQWIDLIKECI